MLAPVRYIQDLTALRRRRVLREEGSVLVEINDEVNSGDVVARARDSKKYLILDASRALNVPASRVEGLMQRRAGERVEKGSIIAGQRKIAGRLLRAPVDGRVAAISGGQILLQVSEKATELFARIPGTIVDIEENRGVIIESACAWLQGSWGNGRFADGELHMREDNPNLAFTVERIDKNLRGAILIAGYCSQREALELAAQASIGGLLLGSLATRLLPIALKMDYPIVLTEGFGEIPMNGVAHQLLKQYNSQKATLNAEENDPFGDQGPELIIPQTDSENALPPEEVSEVSVGQQVRVVHAAQMGAVGKISKMLSSSTLFPSGLRARGAEVTLSDGSKAVIALANLELLV